MSWELVAQIVVIICVIGFWIALIVDMRDKY